ncbi:hypothetical protein ACIRF8_32265 [Streptomyces sp. NPDC102406]|uniref:hypothetical protein n=1 Tax=Streptomyces sp. NPDC102406 TaxID=3366171 RepID=UPI0038089346
MRIRTATGTAPTTAAVTAAVLLALAGSVAWSAPALAAEPGPGTGTVVLSNEAHDSLVLTDEDERELILTDPSYREAWLHCLRSTQPSHVERNGWGPGYVCIPDGAVQ